MSPVPHPKFREDAASLEAAYLSSDDPIEQSGFHGGRERWVAERSPLVEAIDRDGSFLDVGCANGLLAADVVTWAREVGFAIEPHGVDLGEGLVRLARERHRNHRPNFHAADAWEWDPKRKWSFVYSLLDLSPDELSCEWLERLRGWVEEGGRLIVGSYGSLSRGTAPVDVAQVMSKCGFEVVGETRGGKGPITRFAWIEC